jgi:hypothetical protein
MYYATLKKIESTHNNVRTDTVKGLVPEMPTTGKPFFMYSSEVLTPGTNLRHIYTTEIKEVTVNEENGDIVFRTENSLYVLTSIVRAFTTDEGVFNEIDRQCDDDCC